MLATDETTPGPGSKPGPTPPTPALAQLTPAALPWEAPAPAPPIRARAPLQWLGSLPGRGLDALCRSGRPDAVPDAGLSLDALAARVRESPRANAYLSLEPGLRQILTNDGLVTWAAARRHAFIVGGVHAPDPDAFTRILAHARGALAAARYRRVLLFPLASDERHAACAAGFKSMMVGAEAIIDPHGFVLHGKRHADLRQMVNRGTKRYGLRVSELSPVTHHGVMAQLYWRWLDDRPAGHRMQLLVGTPCLERPAGRRYFGVFAPGDAQHPVPVAFVSLTPGWGGRGWGLDVMVRSPDAPAGAMDVLLTHIIGQLADEGAERFSLGACPMAERTPIPSGDSRVLRAVFRWLYRSSLARRLFPFDSLARYKDKFTPTWEAVHLAGWPTINAGALYTGCRMWGLFGPPPLTIGAHPAPVASL